MIGQLWWLLQCQPREVQLRTEDIYITNVECGTDGTMFLSHEGELYACGNNQANKLGLNEQSGWVFSGTYVVITKSLSLQEAFSLLVALQKNPLTIIFHLQAR